MAFIVKNPSSGVFTLKDTFLFLEIQPGEEVDLEGIFTHEQLYYSSLEPQALWTAINISALIRRSNDLVPIDVPIDIAFYDPVWRYSPDRGQWEALVGTVPIPSSTNRYVTEADFGFGSTVKTTDNVEKVLYEIEVPNNCVMMLQTWVTAARESGLKGQLGDSGAFIKIGTVKNISGILSLNLVESAYTFRDQPSWLVKMDVLGTKARVKVQGAMENTINWTGKTRNQVQRF